MVDRIIKNVHLIGMPWAIIGDLNLGASIMNSMLVEWQVTHAKVMSVGNTCFTKESKSSIGYGVVDRVLATWLWHGRAATTGLATHRPVEWCMKCSGMDSLKWYSHAPKRHWTTSRGRAGAGIPITWPSWQGSLRKLSGCAKNGAVFGLHWTVLRQMTS